jgi:hypothetical protein
MLKHDFALLPFGRIGKQRAVRTGPNNLCKEHLHLCPKGQTASKHPSTVHAMWEWNLPFLNPLVIFNSKEVARRFI